MINWYKNLYIGATIKRNYKKYMKRIQRGKLTVDIYLLTIAANGVDQLDIISANALLQKSVRNICPMIIGIAKGYDEAMDLLIDLTKEVYQATDNLDFKTYILHNQG